MKWNQNTLFLGILFLIVGSLLILISSGSVGQGVFFVFPFFFFGISDTVSIVFFLAFILVFFLIIFKSISIITKENARFISDSFLEVESKCEFCSAPLPINAKFCAKCGNPVDYEQYSNQ